VIEYYLYNYAPHIFLIALIGVIFYFAYRKRVGQKERLRKIALHLGLKFSDQEMEWSEPHEGLTDSVEPVEPAGSKKATPVADMVRLVSGWRMEGRYNGMQVRIFSKRMHGTERSKTESTCISAFAKWESNCSLMITRETMLSRLGKAVLTMQDINTTNEALNRNVIIKGVPEHFVKRIVENSAFQQDLLQLFQLEGMIYVDQHGAHFRKSGTVLDEELYRKVLNQVTKTASALERASES
jgi:hypothetical protein